MRHPKVMVGTLKVAAVASLILVALGCSEKKTTKEIQKEKILATPAEIVSRMHQMTNEIFVFKERQGFLDSKLIAKSVHAITNDSERLELIDQLADCVMSVDVSSFDYHKQFNSLFGIKCVMEDIVIRELPGWWDHGYDEYYEKYYYKYKLRYLAWQRAQIKRTSPKHRIENPYLIKDWAEEEERSYWRQIHYSGIVNYEAELKAIEASFPFQARRMSKESAEKVKKMIEDYLGRPMRTKEQIREDHMNHRNVEFLEKEDPHAAP